MEYTITLVNRNGHKDVFGSYTETSIVSDINEVKDFDSIIKIEFIGFKTQEDRDEFKSKYPKYVNMRRVHCGGEILRLEFDKYNRDNSLNQLTIRRIKKIVNILKNL